MYRKNVKIGNWEKVHLHVGLVSYNLWPGNITYVASRVECLTIATSNPVLTFK